jgi:GNAT superfamily N-acetyltransferase
MSPRHLATRCSAPEAERTGSRISHVAEMLVREIPVAQTRSLRQAILRPHDSEETVAAHEPCDAFALGAFRREELIAVGFIAPDGTPGSWRIRGMATVAHARGEGTGGALLAGLIEHALATGATRVWCNGRSPARSLYERAGFRAISEEFEIPGIGMHFVMEMIAHATTIS